MTANGICYLLLTLAVIGMIGIPLAELFHFIHIGWGVLLFVIGGIVSLFFSAVYGMAAGGM